MITIKTRRLNYRWKFYQPKSTIPRGVGMPVKCFFCSVTTYKPGPERWMFRFKKRQPKSGEGLRVERACPACQEQAQAS